MSQRVTKRPPAPKLPQLPPEVEDEDDSEGHDLRMGFFEHLDELRKRVFKALLGLIAGTVIGAIVAGPVMQYLITPYGHLLQVLGPTEPVVAYFRVALMIGAMIAMPLIVYQLLMFILPGLTRKEARLLLTSLPAIMLLFIVGALFAWFILIPPALGFLESFQPTLFKPEWTADLYFSFITALVFWMGVAFETPLIFFVLSMIGLVGPGALLRNWRVAIVGAAIAAAAITPTIDPVNMFLVMGPLLTLYALSILLVSIGQRINLARQ
jgi:sec-independent protein translocase protein TatC